MRIHRGGQNICGATIGVVCLDSRFPKPPGHIKNPSGLRFPVLYETIPGATIPKLLNNPTPELGAEFVAAARRLEQEGVRAITGSCGFMALYQKELAAAVDVPVFASSLIQVPLAYHMTGASAPVGVLTANSASLTDRHLEAVGAGGIPIVVRGMENSSEFAEVILRNERNGMDLDKIEAEVIAAALDLVAQSPEIRSIVLECTDLPPYADRLQEAVKRPIFDLTTLAGLVHDVVLRLPATGFMPA